MGGVENFYLTSIISSYLDRDVVARELPVQLYPAINKAIKYDAYCFYNSTSKVLLEAYVSVIDIWNVARNVHARH